MPSKRLHAALFLLNRLKSRLYKERQTELYTPILSHLPIKNNKTKSWPQKRFYYLPFHSSISTSNIKIRRAAFIQVLPFLETKPFAYWPRPSYTSHHILQCRTTASDFSFVADSLMRQQKRVRSDKLVRSHLSTAHYWKRKYFTLTDLVRLTSLTTFCSIVPTANDGFSATELLM